MTLYVVAGDPKDDCLSLLLEHPALDNQDKYMAVQSVAPLQDPFWLHAQILGTSFEQSKEYTGTVRKNLMDPISKVNGYTDSVKRASESIDQPIENRYSSASRDLLQQITVELHSVSQTIDSGMANAEMSIRLDESMLEAHRAYALFRSRPLGSSPVEQSLAYLKDSWHSQKSWLWHYKQRKDTAMGFVFNTVTQQDSAVNIETARNMARDSSSMNAITILTMIFLPATFVAGVFNSGIVTTELEHSLYISPLLLPFIYTVLPFTLSVVLFFYLFRERLRRLRRRVFTLLRRNKPSVADKMV